MWLVQGYWAIQEMREQAWRMGYGAAPAPGVIRQVWLRGSLCREGERLSGALTDTGPKGSDCKAAVSAAVAGRKEWGRVAAHV